MKNDKSLKLKLILISCLVIFLLSACSSNQEQPEVTQGSGNITAPNQGTNSDNELVQQEKDGISSSEEEEESPLQTAPPAVPVPPKLTLLIYGVDAELTGLVEGSFEVVFEDELTVIHAMLEQLQQHESEGWLSLWKNIEFTSVNLADGNVMIDVSFDDSARSGAMVELYMIDSLLRTLFQLPSVQTVTLLVDGQPADSLMGHVSIKEPFTRKK